MATNAGLAEMGSVDLRSALRVPNSKAESLGVSKSDSALSLEYGIAQIAFSAGMVSGAVVSAMGWGPFWLGCLLGGVVTLLGLVWAAPSASASS